MTALADTRAISPTTTAKTAALKAGANVSVLLALLAQQLVEVRALLAIIISLTPSGDANLSALDAILAELA